MSFIVIQTTKYPAITLAPLLLAQPRLILQLWVQLRRNSVALQILFQSKGPAAAGYVASNGFRIEDPSSN